MKKTDSRTKPVTVLIDEKKKAGKDKKQSTVKKGQRVTTIPGAL